MTLSQFLFLLATGFLAGTSNALVGGGTLFSFPVLLASGLSPIIANTTAKIALVPGAATSAYAYLPELKRVRHTLPLRMAVAVVGGLIGAVLLLEALNCVDRPGMLFPEITEAAEIIRAVDSPLCRLVFDVYHVQAQSGDLIGNIDRCWDEIGYFQIGDNPGRFEPGTGEINFVSILSHFHGRGYRGIVDMEHKVKGEGATGEAAMLAAYCKLYTEAEKIITNSPTEHS